MATKFKKKRQKKTQNGVQAIIVLHIYQELSILIPQWQQGFFARSPEIWHSLVLREQRQKTSKIVVEKGPASGAGSTSPRGRVLLRLGCSWRWLQKPPCPLGEVWLESWGSVLSAPAWTTRYCLTVDHLLSGAIISSDKTLLCTAVYFSKF